MNLGKAWSLTYSPDDSDGTTDRAVYRNGAWHVQGQPAAFVGVNGDIPLPLPQAIDRAFF